MASVNKVIIIGRLGKDPEFKVIPSGKAVANFSVATTDRWTDQGGQKQEKTEWHNIVAWGRTAEIANQYLKKGNPVYIEGSLQTRTWDDGDGKKRYMTEIVANSLQMLGNKGDSGRPASQAQATQPSNIEDDLPF